MRKRKRVRIHEKEESLVETKPILSKFALIEIENPTSQQASTNNLSQRFFKLKIGSDVPFDIFEEDIKKSGNYESELDTIKACILRLMNGERVPLSLFKPLKTNKKDPIQDFEFKTKHLRLYVFKDRGTGKVIVLGGFKNPKQQKKDIKTLRAIKNDFFKERENINIEENGLESTNENQ